MFLILSGYVFDCSHLQLARFCEFVHIALQLGACLCLSACLPHCRKQSLTQKQLPL